MITKDDASVIIEGGNYEDWKAHSLEEDAATAGRVSLTVKQNGHHISSVAESTDIDRSSVQAYVAAINVIRRIEARRKANKADVSRDVTNFEVEQPMH